MKKLNFRQRKEAFVNNSKKRKKIPIWIKIIMFILAGAIILAGFAYGYIRYSLSKINQVDKNKSVSISPVDESFEADADIPADSEVKHMNPEDVIWSGADLDIMKDKDVVNILLIGQDKREGQDRQRSDSMILATLNKKTKEISITSFMRDLYVQIPGYSDNRMNAAYAFGGMDLLDSTIEQNFGIKIDGNIEVDFSGFKIIVDKLGGINMELRQEEADYLNENGNWSDNDASAGTWNLSEGRNHLTGEQALAYSRIRYVGNSDYERTERQRKVLMTAFDKMMSAGPGTIVSLINESLPLITTDLSSEEILGYAMEVVKMGSDGMKSYRIPVDNGYTPAVIRQMQVLVPDLEINRNYLRKMLYSSE